MSLFVEYSGVRASSTKFEFVSDGVKVSGPYVSGTALSGKYIWQPLGTPEIEIFDPRSFFFSDDGTTYKIEMTETAVPNVWDLAVYKDGSTTALETADDVLAPVIEIFHPDVESSGGNGTTAPSATISNTNVTATDLTTLTFTKDDRSATVTGDDDRTILLYSVDAITNSSQAYDLDADYDYDAMTDDDDTPNNYPLADHYSIRRQVENVDTLLEDITPDSPATGSSYPAVTEQLAFFTRTKTGDTYSPAYTGPTVLPDLLDDDGYTEDDLGATAAFFVYGFEDANDFPLKNHKSVVYATWTQEINFTNVGVPV